MQSMYTDIAGTFLKEYEHRRYTLMEKYAHLFDARRIFSIIVPPDAEELDDVSFYQSGMKWQDYPFRSAIIRIGQNVWKDSSFETFYAEARGLGKALGGYWFYDDRVSPDAQAQVVIEAMRGKYFEKEIYIDYERRYSGNYFGLSNVKRMIELIEAAGVKCKTVGVYTGYYFWTDNTKTDTSYYPFFASRPLWLAWYASPSVVKVPLPWTDYTDWQYGTKAIYHGQPTLEIDVNKSRFTQTEYGNIYLGGMPPPPTGEPMIYNLKVIASQLNGRGTPGGVIKFTFLAGDIVVADEKQLYNGADWYGIIKLTRNGVVTPLPEPKIWASAGSTYQYMQIITAPEPPPVVPTLPDLPVSITLGDDVTYIKQTVNILLKPK